MNKTIALILLGAVVGLGLGYAATYEKAPQAGGFIHTIQEYFNSGLRAGSLQQFQISNAGVVSSSARVYLNAETTLGNCGTVTWNPGSIASTTVGTTTDIALSGSAVGDVCLASLDSATSTSANVLCDINATATATIKLINRGATALDLATGTAKVCYFD